MMKEICWLWAMWRAKRIYRARGTMFSHRLNFMEHLRPFIGQETRIAYPDAIFWIEPKDVTRAKSLMTDKR